MLRKTKKSPEDLTTAHLNQIIKTQSFLAAINFDLTAFMDLVVKKMQQLTPATGVVIELVEDDEMVYKAATGTVATHVGLRLARANSISGLCVKNGKILRSNDTEKDKRVNLAACRRVQARSLVVAPLFHEKKAAGVLKILSKKPNGFSENDVQTLQLMAGLIGSALAHQILFDTNQKLLKERTQALEELKKTQKLLKYLAHYDNLTDLPNRTLFHDRLKSALLRTQRTKRLNALMYLDIDHFKNINDTFGHHMGDTLLTHFGLRLKKCVRASDTIARLGGDEFVIILEELQTPTNAVSVAKKILTTIQELTLHEQTIRVTTSVGITFFQGENITTDELLKQADRALYQAKENGRNTFHIFAAKPALQTNL